ncbi:uncharacterized protein LOC134189050 [Corticium candelabrum]|uniref:uncharacterized protein LOC134189050 n=1 Tax=Corticium candelabrum TaxID=121492 RepID=UPI002E253FDA|nr:uncharacterized protein LOC134189050 [Corticium candelabrum]
MKIVGRRWQLLIASSILLAAYTCKISVATSFATTSDQFNWVENTIIYLNVPEWMNSEVKSYDGNRSLWRKEIVNMSKSTQWNTTPVQEGSNITFKQPDTWAWANSNWFIEVWLLLINISIYCTIVFIHRWVIPLWHMLSTTTTTSKLWWFLAVVLPDPWDQEGYLDTITFTDYGIPA